MSEALYTLEVLRLAASTAEFPRLVDADARADRRAVTCGSRIAVDLKLGHDGSVRQVGQEVHACALGQAAATIFARHAVGKAPDELIAARDAFARWLADPDAPPPDWPDVDVLDRARLYPSRHGAMRLPFEAAADAAALIKA